METGVHPGEGIKVLELVPDCDPVITVFVCNAPDGSGVH